MIKTLLILVSISVLAIGVLIGAMFGWVALATDDVLASAEQFLEALNEEDGEAAYSMTSRGLHDSQSKERFLREVAGLRQSEFQLEPWWRQTLPQGKIAAVEVFTGSGPNAGTPVVLEMVNEGGWKIRTATDWARFEVGPGAWFRRVPAEAEIREMVEATLLTLNEAAATGDFATFIEKVGGVDDVARSSFVESFDRLVESGTDFGGIAEIDAILESPSDWQRLTRCAAFGGCNTIVTTNIQVTGQYVLGPSPLRFDLFYAYVHPNWVLGCAPTVRVCSVEIGGQEE